TSRDPGISSVANGSERRAGRAQTRHAHFDRATRSGSAYRRHHFSFSRRSNREKFHPRSQSRVAGSAGVAGAAAQSGIRFARDYLETDRARRNGAPNESALAQREIASGGENWMSRSRKNWNTVNAASLARWIVLSALLALMMLSYVYLTLQLYRLYVRKKTLKS